MILLLLFGLSFVVLGAAFTISQRFTIGAYSYVENLAIEANAVINPKDSIDAAKTGTLTTRTDADTGSVTAQAAHGIITGDRLDVYWAGGSRRGMTVGTVSGTTVPIDGGAGDDLPIATTALTLMVPTEVDFTVDGDNVQGIVYAATAKGTIVFTDGSDVEVDSHVFTAKGNAEWHTGSGITNPFAAETIAKCYLSHGDSTKAQTVQALVAIN